MINAWQQSTGDTDFKAQLNTVCQIENWPIPFIRSKGLGRNNDSMFMSVASLTIGHTIHESAPGIAKIKAEAERQAAKNLLKIIVPLMKTPPEKISGDKKQHLENPVVLLHNFCSQYKRSIPVYSFEFEYGKSKTVVICKCEITHRGKGKNVSKIAKAGSKKEAQRAAAKMVHEVLTR